MEFDFTTKAGIQKFIITILGIVVTALAMLGVTQAELDVLVSIVTMLAPILAMVAYYIVNQAAATGKAKANQAILETKTEMIKTLAITAPEVAIAIAAPESVAVVAPISLVKDRIKLARQTFSTWEGAKAMMLGTFKDRFEAALRRFASISNSPIEVVRLAVDEVVGVMLDTKTCEKISQTPGFLGAMSSKVDIQIMSDLFTAIDKEPALAYMKTIFMKRALWYAVKSTVDEAVTRVYAGEGNEKSRLALQEFGYTPAEARNVQFSGAYPAGFDPWARVGVSWETMEDL